MRVRMCLIGLGLCLGPVGAVWAAPVAEGSGNELRTQVFRCAEAVTVVVQSQPGRAAVWLPEDGFHFLPRVPAASGSRYQAGDLMVWTKGEEALIQDAHTRYEACRNDPAAALWEGAKLRGVSFRAQGNEPGWYLELNPQREQMLLVTEYGQRQQVLPLPEAEVDPQARRTRYRSALTEGPLEVVIEGLPCVDTMSGAAFEARVEVQLEGQRLQGCGRALY